MGPQSCWLVTANRSARVCLLCFSLDVFVMSYTCGCARMRVIPMCVCICLLVPAVRVCLLVLLLTFVSASSSMGVTAPRCRTSLGAPTWTG